MEVTRILELLSHKEIFPEIQLQLYFIAENCQRLANHPHIPGGKQNAISLYIV